MNRLRWAGAVLVAVAVLYLLLSLPHDGPAQEIQSAIHQGEAQTHAQAAQSIPEHGAALQAAEARTQAAEAGLARARAALARAEQRLAAQQGAPVPVPAGPGATEPLPVAPDPRAEVIARQQVLIEAQDGQIAALGLALKDEQRRSSEFRAAYEAERKATAAQAAATEAWKKAVTTSRWRGRIEGFAAGAALGFLGGRR